MNMKLHKIGVLAISIIPCLACISAGGGVRVACVGDSITYGYRLENPGRDAYPAQLQRMLGDGYEVRNFGVSGLGVYLHLPWRFSKNGKRAWSLSPRCAEALDWKPDIVVAALGANDLEEFHNEFRLGTNGAPVLARGTFRRQYADVLKAFGAKGRSPRIIMWTRLCAMKEKDTAKYGMALPAMADDLKAIADEIGAEGLDMYSATIDSARNEPWPDQVHPPVSGHRAIAEAVFAAIRRSDAPNVEEGRLTWGGREEHLAVVNPAVAAEEERGNVISLRGEWDFSAKQMKRAPFRTGMWELYYKMKWWDVRKINVPGCWEAQGVGHPGMSDCWSAVWDSAPKPLRHKLVGDGWYRRTVEIPAAWAGKRIWLKIGGVKNRGWFWVNETPVAHVENYCGTCKYEITDLVVAGSNAVIAAQVNSDPPCRKGLVNFVHRWGGIVRDIELEATPRTFIDDAWVRGDFDARVAEAHVAVCGDGAAAVRLTIGGKSIEAKTAQSGETVLRLPLADFRPWSPERPNLYTARIELLEDGKVVQTRLERFGVRKFEVRGKEFYLNGKPFYVRGFGDDCTYPITGMSPADRDFHRAHLAKAKAAGFNYVRLHTHCEVPEYFEVADELGIMVQPELPYYSDVPLEGFEFDPVRDVTELWRNYRRHPSFATYSGGNEGSMGGQAFDAAFHRCVKKMDPDRLKINEDSEAAWVNPPESADYVGGPKVMWKRGSFDPDRPFVSHEYLNLCVKLDSRDEPLYNGVWMPPVTRKSRAEWLAERGLSLEWGDRLQDAAHALQRCWQKIGVEHARKDPYSDGYHFWTIVDVPVAQQGTYTAIGLFNPFWMQKRGGFSAKEFAVFNSPRCLLLDVKDDRRVLVSGEALEADFLFANYGDGDVGSGSLEWSLGAAKGVVTTAAAPVGPVRKVASARIRVPEVQKPVKLPLVATLGGTSNSWDFWVFPKRARRDGRGLAVAQNLAAEMERLYEGFALLGTPEAAKSRVVVARAWSKEENEALAEGRRVVAVGKIDDERNVMPGSWWMKEQTGTALLDHPVFGDLPHEGFLSPLLFRIVGRGFPLVGGRRDENDLFMVGEGGADCYVYLARRKVGDGIAYESFGLDLLSGKPEGTAILDGMIDCAMRE